VIRDYLLTVGLVVAGVAHVPWFSGSGVCVCVYLYKIVWFGHIGVSLILPVRASNKTNCSATPRQACRWSTSTRWSGRMATAHGSSRQVCRSMQCSIRRGRGRERDTGKRGRGATARQAQPPNRRRHCAGAWGRGFSQRYR
jgi:hypothetical protein